MSRRSIRPPSDAPLTLETREDSSPRVSEGHVCDMRVNQSLKGLSKRQCISDRNPTEIPELNATFQGLQNQLTRQSTRRMPDRNVQDARHVVRRKQAGGKRLTSTPAYNRDLAWGCLRDDINRTRSKAGLYPFSKGTLSRIDRSHMTLRSVSGDCNTPVSMTPYPSRPMFGTSHPPPNPLKCLYPRWTPGITE